MKGEPEDQASATPYHPEEMTATWGLNVGKSITLHGSARWTPAGVITAGMPHQLCCSPLPP